MRYPENLMILSFNRYMVECECYIFRNADDMKNVLIDTWWNVNFF